MVDPKCRRLAARAAALGMGGVLAFGAVALAGEPTQQELLEQMKVLQSKVERLEAKQEQTAKAADTREVDATVDRVLKDAERRSQLLADGEGFTAGYSKGKFLIQSANGEFVLHPWLQFQFRDVTNYREDVTKFGPGATPGTTVADGTKDTVDNGFELRRMKFGFDGNVFGKDLTYLFLWATNRKTGGPVLEEAWARYKFAEEWGARAGQFKDPLAHESLTSSKRLLAAERSLLTDVFTGGDNFVQGVSLIWEPKMPLRAEAAFTDGANQSNTNFQDFPTNPADFGFAGRIEYLAFGSWGKYEDFSAMKNKEDLLVIGAGADYTEAGDTDTLLHTADAQYECGRLGLYAAYLGRSISNPTGGGSDAYDYGALAQAAYMLDAHWEPFVRYDFIRFDSVSAAADKNVHEITVGANYYVQEHAAKFTIDATWLPNGSPVADDSAGILTNNGGNEYVLRAQFQLLL